MHTLVPFQSHYGVNCILCNSQGTYNITVTAEDNGIDMRRSSTALVTLLLVDNTNRHSPVLDMDEYNVNVPENTNPGDIILTVTATDGDDPASPAGQIANFTITGLDSVYFRIVQNATNNFIANVILKYVNILATVQELVYIS